MQISRCYYFDTIADFQTKSVHSILGELAQKHEFALEERQRNSWEIQIRLLKQWLSDISGWICLEYTIPRMGKRLDCAILKNGIVFVIEFKVGAQTYEANALDQVTDYALDLKNFHEQSHDRYIIPILVCTEAPFENTPLQFYEDKIAKPLRSNGSSLAKIIMEACTKLQAAPIDAMAWIQSPYKPTPTIIEAAQALYRGHRVEEISRSDAGAINLSKTAQAISGVIQASKANGEKSICFLTGVPGSGKTLAGLNIANSWHSEDTSEHAVFLSGNGPLVLVLQEALARDAVKASKERGEQQKKGLFATRAKAFIQNIHFFRDDALKSNQPPFEHIVIFDEAQRAWTRQQTASFMRTKKGIVDFSQSEPEFLISVMDRHSNWATIICLIGGGQEINTGEAGLHEWFDSLRRTFPHWNIYISGRLSDSEYTQGHPLFNPEDTARIRINDNLHLSVSIRSYRSEKVAALVKAVLDREIETAKQLYKEIKDVYPIVLTRSLNSAKDWLQKKARGSERYGLVASAGAMRLKPCGINVKATIDPINWFLNGKDDVRSSYFLEDVATEFDIQGLELDWICVAWDADLRYTQAGWCLKAFRGTAWQDIKEAYARLYLINAYRVLLTRARQGIVIFVPYGCKLDQTRSTTFYDGTYEYLKQIGITELDDNDSNHNN